jgi:hypothetical protein
MDDFGDKAKDLSIALGEFLVPIFTDILELVDGMLSGIGDTWNYLQKQWDKTYFATAWDDINDTVDMVVADIKTGFSDIWGMFSDKKEVIPVFAEDMRLAREDTDDFKIAIKQARLDAILPFTTAVDGMSTALMTADTAWKNLTGNLEREVALDNAETDLKELETAAAKAFGSGAQQDINDYERETLEYLTALQSISGTMDTISQKEIAFKFKMEGPAAAQEYARYLARGAEYGGLSVYDALTLSGISGGLNFRAAGGPVAPGGSYIVGERGPELFTPSSSGNITPNHAMGGGNTITVNVNGGDPNSIVRALQQYVRQSGPVPVNTRAM